MRNKFSRNPPCPELMSSAWVPCIKELDKLIQLAPFSTRAGTRVSQACPPGHTGKVADPLHCARYYHCGRLAQHARWEAGLHECPYPMLFNNATLQCEHFSTVNCGRRDEPKDPCESSLEWPSTHHSFR